MAKTAPGHWLHVTQGRYWLHRGNGDPYARLLCGFDDDPHPAYEQIRARGRLCGSSLGAWVTAEYQLGHELLGHPGLGPPHAAGTTVPQQVMPLNGAFPGVGRDGYERLRESAGLLLGPGAAGCHRPLVTRVCEKVLDGLQGEFDLVADVAGRVPAELLGELFSLSRPQQARLAADVADVSIGLDSLLCPQQLAGTRRMLDALADLHALFTEAAAGPGPGWASMEHAQALGLLLAVAGAPASATLIANTLLALLEHPRQWAEIVAAPDRASQAVDETSRYDPPVLLEAMATRTELEIAGHHLPAGAQVVVLIGAANRDPAVFTDPGRFAPGRQALPGPGPLQAGLPHRMLAPLGQLQAEVVIRMMAERFPRLRRSGPVLRRRRAPVTRSPARCRVTAA